MKEQQEIIQKICSRCRKLKSIVDFYRNRKYGENGRHYECKVCMTESVERKSFSGNRQIVLKRDNYICVKCGMTEKQSFKKWNKSLTVDHIDRKGSTSKIKNNDLSNLQTLCHSCHGKKDSFKKMITYNGVTKNVTEWAKHLGMSQPTLSFRLANYWTIEEALTTPVNPHNKQHLKKNFKGEVISKRIPMTR